MKKLSILALVLLLIASTASPVSASSPGRPQRPGPYANYLNAIAQDISHIGTQLNSLFIPDPGPPDAFAGRLGAIANQLEGIQNRLSRQPGPPTIPNPGPPESPPDIRAALTAIQGEAEGVALAVDGYLEGQTELPPLEVVLALWDISGTAETIADLCGQLLARDG